MTSALMYGQGPFTVKIGMQRHPLLQQLVMNWPIGSKWIELLNYTDLKNACFLKHVLHSMYKDTPEKAVRHAFGVVNRTEICEEESMSKDETKPNGVFMVPPPLSIMPTIMAQVDELVKNMPPEDSLQFLADVRTTEGINVALVKRLDEKGKIAIAAWFGKKWGEPVIGGVTFRARV